MRRFDFLEAGKRDGRCDDVRVGKVNEGASEVKLCETNGPTRSFQDATTDRSSSFKPQGLQVRECRDETAESDLQVTLYLADPSVHLESEMSQSFLSWYCIVQRSDDSVDRRGEWIAESDVQVLQLQAFDESTEISRLVAAPRKIKVDGAEVGKKISELERLDQMEGVAIVPTVFGENDPEPSDTGSIEPISD